MELYRAVSYLFGNTILKIHIVLTAATFNVVLVATMFEMIPLC